MKSITFEEAENRISKIYNSEYKLIRIFKEGSYRKAEVNCCKHGNFISILNNLLAGHGCPKCAIQKRKQCQPISNSEFIQKAKKAHPNFLYNETNYTGNLSKIKVICPKHGSVEVIPKTFLKNKFGCPLCAKEHLIENAQKSNLKKQKECKENFKQLVKESFPNLDISESEYIDTSTPVKVKCLKHGYFEIGPHNLLRSKSNGCPICKKEHFEQNNKKEQEIFKQKVLSEEKKLVDYSFGEFKNSRTKIKVVCKKCSKEFKIYPKDVSICCCPYCSRKHSLGERRIINFLQNNNIDFEIEYTFKDLKDKNYLRFDFYIPSKKLLIEYDGEQHFKPNKKFGLETFEILKLHDSMKNEYVKENNLNLLRISYIDFDNIESILTEKLNI